MFTFYRSINGSMNCALLELLPNLVGSLVFAFEIRSFFQIERKMEPDSF